MGQSSQSKPSARSLLAMTGSVHKSSFSKNVQNLTKVVPALKHAAEEMRVPFSSISGRLCGSDNLVDDTKTII
jgi:hypothetical protein